MSTSHPSFQLIVGLGNPEKAYAATYHNVGMQFVSFLREQLSPAKRTYSSSTIALFRAPSCAFLGIPRISMNHSGRAVLSAMHHTHTSLKELLLVHDDADIALGAYTLSFGRGAAGHKGVLSVMRELHTTQFFRLRIGIRAHRKDGSSRASLPARKKAEDFVLTNITPHDRPVLKKVFGEATVTLSLTQPREKMLLPSSQS